MNSVLAVKINYSTSHYFFPKIIIGILIVLAIVLVIQKALQIRREKGKETKKESFRFFIKDFDKLKLFGTFGLLIAYIACLKPLGFLVSSLIFIFLFNVLFCGTLKIKSLCTSAAISVISSTLVWYVFGVLFRITLP